MQLGMVGLGRMGANLTRRLMRGGHEVVVYDVNADAVRQLEGEGVDRDGLARGLREQALEAARGLGDGAGRVRGADHRRARRADGAGDIVIDGGNSYYRDDVDRAERYAEKGVHFVDVGTSGGVFGLERGFCLMIGGEDEVVQRLDPIFATIAPGVEAAAHAGPDRRERDHRRGGYLHCGPPGAGHFVKMVHNGIEYGLMAAYAEGLNVLNHADVGAGEREADAETTPLRDPKYYRYDLNIPEIAEVWRRGSVVASWLLDLTAAALVEDPELEGFGGRVSRLGRGPVDRARGRGRGRARPRAVGGAVRPVRVAQARPSSRTGSCRRCASSSAGTPRRRRNEPFGPSVDEIINEPRRLVRRDVRRILDPNVDVLLGPAFLLPA